MLASLVTCSNYIWRRCVGQKCWMEEEWNFWLVIACIITFSRRLCRNLSRLIKMRPVVWELVVCSVIIWRCGVYVMSFVWLLFKEIGDGTKLLSLLVDGLAFCSCIVLSKLLFLCWKCYSVDEKKLVYGFGWFVVVALFRSWNWIWLLWLELGVSVNRNFLHFRITQMKFTLYSCEYRDSAERKRIFVAWKQVVVETCWWSLCDIVTKNYHSVSLTPCWDFWVDIFKEVVIPIFKLRVWLWMIY